MEQTMPPPRREDTTPDRPLQPATLKWQENGELSAHDVFNLICRLRAVESGEHSNELWRLGHKYPGTTPPGAMPPGTIPPGTIPPDANQG
jgi:hypothetical protein